MVQKGRKRLFQHRQEEICESVPWADWSCNYYFVYLLADYSAGKRKNGEDAATENARNQR